MINLQGFKNLEGLKAGKQKNLQGFGNLEGLVKGETQMNFEQGELFHLYNRANSQDEIIFHERENYLYFLKQYRKYLEKYFDTICYCLIPNHFHFLVKVKELDENLQSNNKNLQGLKDLEGLKAKKQKNLQGFKNLEGLNIKIIQSISNFLNSYAKAFNKKYKRRGSLFQKRTKSKHIDQEKYLQRIARYIHRNPLKHKLITNLEDWEFSSYPDYIGQRNGNLPGKNIVLQNFIDIQDFRNFTEKRLDDYEEEFEKYILD